LEDALPPIKKGDSLSFESTAGRSSVVIERVLDVDGKSFIELRDRLQLLRPGVPVRLQTIESTNPYLACAIVLGIVAVLGLVHGLLITWGNLQPFVVTLCGLLIYRGLARVLTGDNQVGLLGALPEFKARFTGAVFELPVPFVARLGNPESAWSEISWIEIPFSGVVLAFVAILGWVFLNRTVWGRHLLATGENEKAARYSGVRTQSLIVAAYTVCALLAGLTGILFTLELNSVQPGSSGSFYELYAIAAAVLGGCSLRGGRGAILSVIAGAAVMRCLYKSIIVLGISQEWEMVIIGVALLSAVSLDEFVLRWTARKRRHSIG
jgi:ribose transport system permease protein